MKHKKQWIPIMLFCIFIIGCMSIPFYIQYKNDVEEYHDLIERTHQTFEDGDVFVLIKSKGYLIYPFVDSHMRHGLCLTDLNDCDLKEKIGLIQFYRGHGQHEWMNDYIPYVIYNYEMYGGKEIIVGTKDRPIFPPILRHDDERSAK